MKRLLIIGAGFLQAFVIKKASEMGYLTCTIDRNPKAEGFSHADEYDVIDVVDQKACLEYALSKKIDGVMTAATDFGVLSASYVAQHMHLPGLDYEVAVVIKNKAVVRQKLFENKVDDISQYYEISGTNQLHKYLQQIRFPVIVKPCDGSGSKAVQRADSAHDLQKACSEAIVASLAGKALVEDFICGREYGVESFVHNGKPYVLGVMAKHMTSPPDYAELGHFLPCQLPTEKKIRAVVCSALKKLGINFGAVNMDILVTPEGRITIIDVGARMGGNLIGSHIIPFGTGIDYMANLIRATVGDSVNLKPTVPKTCVATRLLALRPGRVIGLPDFGSIMKQCRVNIYHHLNVGDIIREYHNNLDGCGYVVAVSDDVEDANGRAEHAKQLIDSEIVRA
jgi:biotin carboxylase